MKKKIILALLFLFASAYCVVAQKFEKKFIGVWANDNCELLQTDSVFLFFERQNSGALSATMIIPSREIRVSTTFENDSTIIQKEVVMQITERFNDNGTLMVGSHTLKKVESLTFTAPYNMPFADSSEAVGKRLQEWRLGVSLEFDKSSGTYYMEANTNRHMFVYAIMPNIKYIRAAATRNVDKGTLFFQNIRMMSNNNTKELTKVIDGDNFKLVSTPLVIDESKFVPNTCFFDPNGGIYWSYISSTPDKIQLNGCGEIYYVNRKMKNTPLLEWIKYDPY